MKRLLLLDALLVLCLTGCDDSNEPSHGVASGSISLYGNTYYVSSGVLWHNNPNIVTTSEPYDYEDTYEKNGTTVVDVINGFKAGTEEISSGNFMISLYENGLTFSPEVEKALGTGATVCLHLASPETGRLVPGTYLYGTDLKPNTFTAYCSSQYNAQDNNVVPATITDGEVSVETSGDEYTIKFDCITSFGGAVTGTYKGKLDYCRVSQISSVEYDDISLSGLMQEVEVITWYGRDIVESLVAQYIEYGFLPDGISLEVACELLGLEHTFQDGQEKFISWEESGTALDTGYNGFAFFSISSGQCQNASGSRRTPDQWDIALKYDDEKSEFFFESPIRMRDWLDHGKNYKYECHTVYMNAPASFTDEDFDNLSADDFTIDITEEKVTIPTENFKTSYLFFQTGRGTLGVIKVKGWTPKGTKSSYDPMSANYQDVTLNPSLILEIKCPATVATPPIR